MTHRWQQLHLEVNPNLIDHVSELLESFNALSVTYKDLDNKAISVDALFDYGTNLAPFIDQLKDHIISHKIDLIADQNWQKRAIADLKPLFFGKFLCVCPSWLTPPDSKKINIMLDPGLAFGTGAHQTTELCLEWLDNNVKKDDVVIDYGCGSGILAIAAVKLGAKKSFAVDIDPDAITTSRDNANNNQILESQLILSQPNALQNVQADILVANILANPLIELAPEIAKLLKTGGKLALSGILKEQASKVITAYNPWFKMHKVKTKDEWVLLTGKKIQSLLEYRNNYKYNP